MTETQVKLAFAVAAALCSYALATDLHPDVVLGPVVQFVLGGVLVALAIINPGNQATK